MAHLCLPPRAKIIAICFGVVVTEAVKTHTRRGFRSRRSIFPAVNIGRRVGVEPDAILRGGQKIPDAVFSRGGLVFAGRGARGGRRRFRRMCVRRVARKSPCVEAWVVWRLKKRQKSRKSGYFSRSAGWPPRVHGLQFPDAHVRVDGGGFEFGVSAEASVARRRRPPGRLGVFGAEPCGRAGVLQSGKSFSIKGLG